MAALEEQLNNLLDFTRRHVAEVRTRLKLGVVTKEELYHLGDVLLSLQSTLIRGLQDLMDLADVFDNLNGNSNAASDFLQSLDVLEKKNRVEDDITSELATLYSLLKDTSTKSKLLRRGTISGETRKQKHGYHVIGSPILLVAMWLVLLLTTQPTLTNIGSRMINAKPWYNNDIKHDPILICYLHCVNVDIATWNRLIKSWDNS